VRAAIAFVTQTGVDLLSELLSRHPHVTELTIVARGASITEPEALLALRAELNAEVSVMVGPSASRFHPKTWLLSGDYGLWVLSGSGNLTLGGLCDNREQFEIFHAQDAASIQAQEERLSRLTEGAIPLDEFEGSIAWRTWVEQQDRRRRLEEQLTSLDRAVTDSHSINREPHKRDLMRDLWQIHDETLAAKLRKKDGSPYNPSGFRLQLEGNRGSGEPLLIVKSLCKSGTEGFETIEENDRRDLTVESLVVDKTKRYHSLFPTETVRLATERLERFNPSRREDR
jgi:hypothetical protein